ncbi:MAG: DUF6036 family nucleotidyltransferase [Pyrinomonadaceae bacterium]
MPNKVKVNSSSIMKSIPTEVGIEAAELVTGVANENNIAIALAGGIAMHIYGFTRATTDVDMLAQEVLPLESQSKLSFGGENYQVYVSERAVSVDVIVRNDELAKIYETALSQANETNIGIKIISTEWLVVMKYFSARAKDKIDLIWLLQEEGLVDRKLIESNLTDAVGSQSAFFIYSDLKSEFDYADFLKHRERSKHE